jgi:CMP-N-acetylneuraminic acid synthetase
MKHRLVAILPMRHSSERMVGKNYREFAGKPLFHHILHSLLSCQIIDKIVVDTDSPIIIDQVKKLFPDVQIVVRPKHLCDGKTPMNEVLLNTINQIPSEFYLQTHSTNPNLTVNSIKGAINKFLEIYPSYDSLFSVTKRQVRYWDSLARPVNHNQSILLRTQDLPPIYEENSCIYIFNRDILERKHNRIGERPFLFEIPEIEAQDIDAELNFLVAEFLFSKAHSS